MFESIKKEILSELRRDTNGAVVGAMSEILGGEEFVNFGVTISHIKYIAAKYYPNHELALDMFNSKIRELKLCAIYIDEGDKVSIKQMNQWSKSFVSQEIAEHSASMLFFKANDSLKMAKEWLCEKENDSLHYAALLMTSKRAKIEYEIKERESYHLIINSALHYLENPQIFRVFCTLIANLSRSDNYFLKEMRNMDISDTVRAEIDWQL